VYDIFGSLQSLIWLLMVIIIIAVVVWAVRMALAPREPRAYREAPIVQQPPTTSGLAPGWYPDQNDPNSMRYYDGRAWTSQTEPRR
jgi:Protein of unknown function (DUF2510)